MANGQLTDPSWDQLLNVGIGYVKESQPAWLFVAALVGLQVIQALFIGSQALSSIVGLVALAAGIYLSLMLSRHALTGEWGLRDTDHGAALRIFGMVLLIVLVIILVGGLVVGALGMSMGQGGIWLGVLIIGGILLWIVARFGFYVPALAVGHPTSLGEAFKQSGPYWGRIMAVMIGPGVIVLGINLVLGLLFHGWFGSILAALIGGAVAAIGQAITLAAISYLYANFVRRGQAA
jgi:hypothetical protein